MTFTVVLPPDLIARAHATAEERPRTIKHHKPAAHKDGEISGALSEHAWAYYFKINPDEVKSDGGAYGHGDGGIDFVMNGLTIDIKSSPLHKFSWVVGAGKVRADWLVFAYVILPDTVTFVAKAPGPFIQKFGLVPKVGNKRLVTFEELDEEWRDVNSGDFTKKGVTKLKKQSQKLCG